MVILKGLEADTIRQKYILSFIDIKSNYYINKIKKMNFFEDGLCYTGYLWDCYKESIIISEGECENFLFSQNNLYIMWDIHSAQRIFVPDYWKYGKSNIIFWEKWKGLDACKDFPEDIYVFDMSFQWSISFTHETDQAKNRYCMFAQRKI